MTPEEVRAIVREELARAMAPIVEGAVESLKSFDLIPFGVISGLDVFGDTDWRGVFSELLGGNGDDPQYN